MKKKSYKKLIQIFLWSGAIGIVFVVGISYFPKECKELSFYGSFYYTLRLFILEHDLPDFPRAWPLVFIYFFAPVVALSAVGKAITYFIHLSPFLRTRQMKDHVIVCGVGRTGKILASTLKKKGIAVVGVDDSPVENFEDWSSEHNLPIIFGDFHSELVLKKAGAMGARAIIFASGDDLTNLEGAVSAYGWLYSETGPFRIIWTHIANEKLADTARAALLTKGKIGIRFFDTYHIAAEKMVKKHFKKNMREGIRKINILGFGKFGRDLMEVIARDLEHKSDITIRVIDVKDRKNEVNSFAKGLTIFDKITFIQADIRNIHITNGDTKAFFLCTDDDIGNLAIALMLTENTASTHIYVRMAKWPIPSIEEHLREKKGVTFVNINDMVKNGILDLPGIFKPAKATDMKRFETSTSSSRKKDLLNISGLFV